MEFLIGIALVVMAFSFLLKDLTNFIKQLHSFKPKGLLNNGKKLNFNLTISSINRKKEVCASITNSKKDNLD